MAGLFSIKGYQIVFKMPINGTEMCAYYNFDQTFVLLLNNSFNNVHVGTYHVDLVI